MDWIIPGGALLRGLLLVLRLITPLPAAYVVWRSFTSFRKGQRGKEPLLVLVDESTDMEIPVLYWENSIGRAKSCDIVLPDGAISRDHAVLMRRDEGWFICDTGSKAGVLVNGEPVEGRALVNLGDRITLGNMTLSLWNTGVTGRQKRRRFTGFSKEAASPAKLMTAASFVQILMGVQAALSQGSFDFRYLIPTLLVLVMGWGLYAVSMGVQHRVSFEVETVAWLLSGIGIHMLAAFDIDGLTTQLAAMLLGVVLFCFLVWFLGDLDRVAKFTLPMGVGALLLFAATLVLGRSVYGAKNWIFIGPVSVQPSEFIKIAFVFAGTATLDRLQTTKNITLFLAFAGACVGFLAIMRDFGTALIFFSGFLIIAFMRSGSVRTIALVLMAAVLGVLVVLRFRPYVMDRFAGWGHAWEHVYDEMGFQQTRVMTYIASGGLFGMGLGAGMLAGIFAADSDLIFGLLCEEQGFLLGAIVVVAIALFVLYARSDVTRSRSTFFSIGACAAAGMLLFQTCLNVFGPTDLLPFTGVTLPFLSAGGSSMISVWGMMAFIKAADERTYAARRANRKTLPDWADTGEVSLR